MAQGSQELEASKGSLFADINALRHADPNKEADEEERQRAKFKEHTLCGQIARNKYFEYFTLAVITFNALYLGYDCDYSTRWGKPENLYESTLVGFILLDNFFCLYFSFEVVVRFFAYKSKIVAMKDGAFLFDLALVTMMVLETWVLAFVGSIDALKQVSILRLLRLTRLLRMGKIMRYFPELQLIVKGMVAAVRSVGCAGILLMLVLYVFSIIFTNEYHQGLKADDDEDLTPSEQLFGSMGKSMRHLLIMGTILDDLTACTNAIRNSGSISMLLIFFVCVLISSFTLFNMLLGILCEVVEATGNNEQAKAELENLHTTMTHFFKAMDLDGNGEISRNEFVGMCRDEVVMQQMECLNINQGEFQKYAELLFTPANPGDKPPTLQYDDAVNMIMRLRPGQTVNALDFLNMKRVIMKNNHGIMKQLEGLEDVLEELHRIGEQESDDEPDPTEEECAKLGLKQGSTRNSVTNAMHDQGITSPITSGSNWNPAPTVSRLARSEAYKMAEAPPVSNRWAEKEGNGTPSPRGALSPKASPRESVGEDVLQTRMQKLKQQRRPNNNVQNMTSGGWQVHMSYYHGTNSTQDDLPFSISGNSLIQLPPLALSDNARDDEDDDDDLETDRYVFE